MAKPLLGYILAIGASIFGATVTIMVLNLAVNPFAHGNPFKEMSGQLIYQVVAAPVVVAVALYVSAVSGRIKVGQSARLLGAFFFSANFGFVLHLICRRLVGTWGDDLNPLFPILGGALAASAFSVGFLRSDTNV